MKPKTIRQLFRRYGFYEANYGFYQSKKDKLCTFVKAIIPKELRSKNIRMIDRYIREKKLKLEATNMFGKCEVPFIGFSQIIMGFRKKPYKQFCPSKFHQDEMERWRRNEELNCFP